MATRRSNRATPPRISSGRLTWNPFKHIDPLMTIICPSRRSFSPDSLLAVRNPCRSILACIATFERGDIIVSLAGIFANLCLAVICTALIVVFGWLGVRG